MSKTLKTTVEQARSEIEQYDVSKLPEMIDRTSTIFGIASKCAGTKNIYHPNVLMRNKYNATFLLHLRDMEIEAVAEMLSEALVPVMEQEGVVIRIITSNYGTNFKIISNVALGSVIDALKPVVLYKNSFNRANGETQHIYRFSVELTL